MDRAVSSASRPSPPSRTTGTRAVASRSSRPSQARRPPSRRTTTSDTPVEVGSRPRRVGQAKRQRRVGDGPGGQQVGVSGGEEQQHRNSLHGRSSGQSHRISGSECPSAALALWFPTASSSRGALRHDHSNRARRDHPRRRPGGPQGPGAARRRDRPADGGARRHHRERRPRRHLHLAAREVAERPVLGRHGLHAHLRRLPAARRQGRRPVRPARDLHGRRGAVRRRLAARRAVQQPRAADRGPRDPGHRRGTHVTGCAVAAHRHLQGGRGAQQGARHLGGDHRRRGRARPHPRWRADGVRLLALGASWSTCRSPSWRFSVP